MRAIYALLVGIDKYPAPVSQLEGCCNDIEAVETYLRERIDTQKYQLNLKKLCDREATRQAIIEGFEKHLCQAGKDDIALFYYSGHGSNETAPPEFFQFEPDRQIETIVCYDSRLDAGRDLADKELSYLISKVACKKPQIVLILDSCHSGSGTRDTVPQRGVRHASADNRPRELKDFIFSLDDLQPVINFSTDQPSKANQSGWNLPGGRHILLASCQDRELAKEYFGDGRRRGAFSYFLLNTLEQTNGSLTYRELFKRANALVRSRIQDQSPQLEATHFDDLNLPFLGFPGEDAIAQREPFFTLSCDENQQWSIDGGAVHGLPQSSSDEPIRLALYPQGSTAEQMRQRSAAVGEAEVTRVLPQKSVVQFSKEPDHLTTSTVLNAVITSLPLPPLGVVFEGDENALRLLREELATVGVDGQPSLYVREVAADAKFRLLARNNQYLITKPDDDRPLVEQIAGYTQPNAFKAVKRLEHMARWVTTAELSTPANNRIPADAVEMQLYCNGEAVLEPQLRLEYQYRNGKWQNPTFQVKLVNRTEQRLYCALLGLTEQYSIGAPFFGSGGTWLEPKGEAWATMLSAGALKKDIPTSIPNDLWNQGITEYQDILKLIVSTAEFDPRLLSQDKLDKPKSTTRGVAKGGTLNRLMNRITHRDFDVEEADAIDEWMTSQVTIVTVRPQDAATVQKDAPTSLGAGVTLQPHQYLNATARLSTVSQATRDVRAQVLPPLLQENTRPFQFTVSRGSDSGLGVLELTVSQTDALKAVTRKDPLRLTVEQPLAANEIVLPLAYDGEFFLPLGYGITKDGNTEIVIEQLPDPVAQGERSLTGSVRIFFQKVISEQLGREFPYPLLGALDTRQPEMPVILDPALVKQRVTQAKNIVLYIHGIIGDTRSMVSSVRDAKVFIAGQEKPLTEIYDLVLTFDYENLNTPIATIAEQLRDRLAAVGLGIGHGKVLHIVAHSMGGLVSRCFIEQKGGHEVVQHLIMLGTPNGGSPWATVQDWALATLTFALNNLLSVAPPVKLVGKLVGVLEKVDVTLDAMRPDSEFLKSLNAEADPKVPYTIVAGNTSIIDVSSTEAKRRVQALLAKLNRVGRSIIEFPFLGDPNDIAVAVHNIKKVPGNRTYPAQVYEVGCNHLVYFTSPIGLKALADAVSSTGIAGNSFALSQRGNRG